MEDIMGYWWIKCIFLSFSDTVQEKVKLPNISCFSLDVTEFKMPTWCDIKSYVKSVVMVKVLYVSTWTIYSYMNYSYDLVHGFKNTFNCGCYFQGRRQSPVFLINLFSVIIMFYYLLLFILASKRPVEVQIFALIITWH